MRVLCELHLGIHPEGRACVRPRPPTLREWLVHAWRYMTGWKGKP